MFNPGRFAFESARRTRQLSLLEQLSGLLRMEETSGGRPAKEKAKEIYPNCFPPPRGCSSLPGRQPDGAATGQHGQEVGLPHSSFHQAQQEVTQRAPSPNPQGSESLHPGRPTAWFPHPPTAITRSYHTSFPSLAASSTSSSSSANINASVQTRSPSDQSQSKRTLNISSAESKKLRSEISPGTSNDQEKLSLTRQETSDEKVEMLTIRSGDELPSGVTAEGKRPDMSKFKRRWKLTPAGESRYLWPSGTEVSLLCYNVLAQCLIESNDYLYDSCPEEILRWDYRKENLLRELQQAEADIMCLQEVQLSHFRHFFGPELEKLGYASLYQKRTGDKHDGCAIFYKRDKFELEDCKKVRFYRSNIKLLDRDNVGLVALLRAKGSSQARGQPPKLCVATTHLLYNPKRGDIKLAQLGVLLAEIDRLAAATVSPCQPPSAPQPTPLYHPIILCGDFNSLPHSPLYNFIRNRRLDYVGLQKVLVSGQGSSRRSFDPLNWPLWPYDVGVTDACQFRSVVKERLRNRENSDQDKQKQCTEPSDAANEPQDWEKRFSESIHHPFQLASVHSHGSQPREVTTNHSRTNCTVDYIFYSSAPPKLGGMLPEMPSPPVTYAGELKLLEYLSLLTDQEATDMGGLPNHALSSDHFSLQAKFLLIPPE
ncbi:protein angel homolog 2-like [Acanthaster planci]|uniref:Protein angel homolog 2-like n=1 Tax=Acanthaster planci TaxID=133434 RepID=A0A8B7ZPK3_ACAPL|nr:protein angel homolog 2-like [Acanthaster planci]XP_022107511.1 protein angel homolog 2-like [Acanthaster planci]XP_022107512.1 protein angel homolog 2-like [Acanthaster planci]XP_022107513.1 protein angel homolog 2-like [Acanthaster planci]